jgi:hypothetical protein
MRWTRRRVQTVATWVVVAAWVVVYAVALANADRRPAGDRSGAAGRPAAAVGGRRTARVAPPVVGARSRRSGMDRPGRLLSVAVVGAGLGARTTHRAVPDDPP